jgi:dinuclear metal center YbgI/SA1388 family protein
MQLLKVVNFLDSVLNNENFKDYSLNGLQVQNSGSVDKIIAAVDSNLFTINACPDNALLIVHHGLFWGKAFAIKDSNYSKIKALFDKNIALYASHLPLDAHPEIGNNALILKGINAQIVEEFGNYNGINIGFMGEFDKPVNLNKIAVDLQNLIKDKPLLLNFSLKDEIKTVCAVSGSPGMDILNEFLEKDYDLLITGEASHILYNFCEDNGINVICGNHYATETLGVDALGKLAAGEFLLDYNFIKHNTGQ